MDIQLYNTRTLLAIVQRLREPPSNYWLNLLYNRELTFDTEFLDMEKVDSGGRRLAPFVAPLAQGRPIYKEGSNLTRVRPAYIKPKDQVTPTRMMARRPGEITSPVDQNPAQRRNAIITDILLYHDEAIDRRLEWMACRATIDAAVVIADQDYPTRIVDFQRSAAHRVILGSGARWGDTGVSILSNIQAWMDTMALTPFGGQPNRITVGPLAWAVMRGSEELMKQMNTTFRGNDVTIRTGLIETGSVRYVGTLGAGLEVYVYSDFYTLPNGTVQPFMDPRDVVLTSPSLQGVRCFGAIQDAHAGFIATSRYARNWIADDPPFEFIMMQSSPLMVPVNPNASFTARVLA